MYFSSPAGISSSFPDDYTQVGSSTTNTPHDALFKATFETPETAAELLRQILPAPIATAIDWATLRREAGSFIDPTLTASHSDLLFSVRLLPAPDVTVLIYVLFEHQSRSLHEMCLRVLGYMLRGWELYRKDHKGPLPVILPVVLSHDPNGWSAPTSFHELFGSLGTNPLSIIPELAKFVPSFEMRVEDLIEVDDEQLQRWQLGTFALLTLQLLRDVRNPERMQRCLPQWIESVRQLQSTQNGRRAIEQVFRYILLVAGELRFDEFREKLRQQLPETEEIAMTIAEQLRAEGLTKGRAQGRAEGRAEGLALAVTKMLMLKFGALSAEHAARIEAATEQELDRYIERILSAPTAHAVFESSTADDD
jgi:predicted transposase/invertase (TIGR01784 family)